MEGGIKAWEGFVAQGPPEAGIFYFEPGKKPEELVALAWMLEDGSREFYSSASGLLEDREIRFFLQKLSSDEENHKSRLFQIYRELSGMKVDPEFPRSLLRGDSGIQYMEGGVPLTKALEWVRGKEPREILELCISLEVNSEDLYLKMERKVEEKEAKRVFKILAVQEKHHLERLVRLFEKR